MKQKIYTLKYKGDILGKTKTVTKTFTNLNEARKEGRQNIDGHISLVNEKGTHLTL